MAWFVTALHTRPDTKGAKELDDVEARTRRLATEFSRDTIRRRLEWLVLDPASVTDELIDIRYQIYAQSGMIPHMIELMSTVFQMNREKVGDIDYYGHSLSGLKCPVLAIWTDHNPGKSISAIQYAIDAIPDCEFHMVKDAAHWPQWEKADQINELMANFLRRTAA